MSSFYLQHGADIPDSPASSTQLDLFLTDAGTKALLSLKPLNSKYQKYRNNKQHSMGLL